MDQSIHVSMDKRIRHAINLYFILLAISAGKKRYKSANLKKIRRHYNQDTLREHIIPDESNRFRYFYHIRRANGDALSSVSMLCMILCYLNQLIHVYVSLQSRTHTNSCQSQLDKSSSICKWTTRTFTHMQKLSTTI